ncbi:MAG: hypothetical protein HC933_00285 [Pleurocapsa sp. SU_196_0]|nr:hypothetical protein [Pleurocapsa sp. SU_196_0]
MDSYNPFSDSSLEPSTLGVPAVFMRSVLTDWAINSRRDRSFDSSSNPFLFLRILVFGLNLLGRQSP